MKYCDRCGILYANILSACPKCGAAIHKPLPGELPEPSEREKKRQRLGLMVGIPAAILLMCLAGWMFIKLNAH